MTYTDINSKDQLGWALSREVLLMRDHCSALPRLMSGEIAV